MPSTRLSVELVPRFSIAPRAAPG